MTDEDILTAIKKLGAECRARRAELDLTQKELAAKSDISRQAIYKFEGETPPKGMTLDVILRLFDAMNCRVSLDVLKKVVEKPAADNNYKSETIPPTVID